MNFCLDDGVALLDGPRSLEPPTSILPFGGDEALTRQQLTQTGETAVLTSESGVQKVKGRSAKILALLLGFALAAAVIGYSGYKLYSNAGPVAPVRSNVSINTQRLTGDGKARGAEISPDGKFLAYIKSEGGERSIWLKQIQTNSNIAIVKPDELSWFDGMVFSPDGNFLYFNAQANAEDPASVYRIPTPPHAVRHRFANAYVRPLF